MSTPGRHIVRLSVVTLALLLTSCGQDDPSSPGQGSSAGGLPQGSDPVQLDPSEFRPGSDNTYFPLSPGRQWTYRETDGSGGSADVVVTVSSVTTKIADGVEARVVRDTVSEHGEVTEDTKDWYAQDADGNVWYLGEDTAEFEDGKVDTREGSFEAGVNGGLPGVIMPAEPEAGLQYRQEYYQGKAEDNGAVLATGQQAEAAAGHYEDALLTADTSTIEPDVVEYKLYAPGVGLVLTLDASGGAGREELVSTTRVDSETARKAGTAPLGTPYEQGLLTRLSP